MAAFALVDVSEDCYALLLLDATLEDSSDAAPDELSVDDCVRSSSALDLSCFCLISRQFLAYQEVKDGLGP